MEVSEKLASRGAQRDVSTTVVSAVAAARDVDPLELDPLYEVVDPDALDALFRDREPSATDGEAGRVTFTVAGCEVTVYDDDRVTAIPIEDAANQTVADVEDRR